MFPGKPPVYHLGVGDQRVAGVLLGLGALIGVTYLVSVARQERRAYPLYLLAGGVLTVFIEPFVDVLGHCVWPSLHVTRYVETFHVAIPLYQAPTYVLYFAPAIVWLMRRLSGGISMRQWWTYYAVGVVAAVLFELEPVHLRWWGYYGSNQPLDVWGLPLWWSFVNVSSTLLAGATFWVVLQRRLIQARFQIVLVPSVTMVVTGFHVMAGMPVYTAINSSTHVAVTDLAALLTIAIAILSVYVTGRLVTRPVVPAADPGAGPESVELAAANTPPVMA